MPSHATFRTKVFAAAVGLFVALSFFAGVPAYAQSTPDDESISRIMGLAEDSTVEAACLCAGKINTCDNDGNCQEAPYYGCGGVKDPGDCNPKLISNDGALCEGSKSFLCSANTYLHLTSCRYQVIDPSAPLKLADIPGRCKAMRDEVTKQELEADDSVQGEKTINIRKPIINILIPDLSFSDVRSSTDEQGNLVIPWIGEYISALYRLGVSIASVLAVVLLIREGALIILSGGGEEKIQGYRNIARILTGVVLAWSSYVILYNINASLVSFKPLQIRYAQIIDVDASDETTTPGVNYNYEVGLNNVPYFPQWEGPWAEKKPGDLDWPLAGSESRTCATIHERGCGSTSLAMVLKFFGENVTPFETSKWGLGCTGAWKPSITMKDFSNKWPNLKGETIWKGNSTAVLRKKIMTILTSGKPFVFNCAPCKGLTKSGTPYTRKDGTLGYKGHYMVLTGILTSGYTDAMNPAEVVLSVNDPGANAERRIRTMTLEQVLNSYKVGVHIDTASNFTSVNK